MITISAGYRSGDRDNHALGGRVPVCSLLNDAAFKAGLHCERILLGPGNDTVVYSVEFNRTPDGREKSVRFLKSLTERGVCPAHQCEILYETRQDSLTLALAGVHTQPENTRARSQEERREGQEGPVDQRPVEAPAGEGQGPQAG